MTLLFCELLKNISILLVHFRELTGVCLQRNKFFQLFEVAIIAGAWDYFGLFWGVFNSLKLKNCKISQRIHSNYLLVFTY